MIGGRGDTSSSLRSDRATALQRQPGSNFKILSTFLPALDSAGMTLATVYDDAPYNYLDTNRPIRNFYNGYRGYSTIREAISDSMNIIAAKTIADVTPQKSYEYLLDLGFDTLVDDKELDDGTTSTDIHQSLSLGGLTNGVTNLELTNAFASIANGGTYYEPKLYTKVVDQSGNVLLSSDTSGKKVMKKTTSFLLTDAMKDVITDGTGTDAQLSSDMAVAGKSGTTSDRTDYWFSGYTPYHTMSVWMGYDLNTKFSDIPRNFIRKCGPTLWIKSLKQKKKNLPTLTSRTASLRLRFVRNPEKLAIPGVCDHDPRGSMITTEYFAEGTVPTQTCDTHVAVELCRESNEPASSNCPADDRIRKVYIVRQKNARGETDDSPYLLPEEYQTRPVIFTHNNQRETSARQARRGFSLFFHFRLENQRGQIRKNQSRRGAHRSCSKSSFKEPQKSMLIYSLFHPLPEIVPKARQRHGCSASAKFLYLFIYSQSSQNNSGNHQDDHDPPRLKFCVIQQDLHQNTDQSANQKRSDIFHLPFLSFQKNCVSNAGHTFSFIKTCL